MLMNYSGRMFPDAALARQRFGGYQRLPDVLHSRVNGDFQIAREWSVGADRFFDFGQTYPSLPAASSAS